MWFPIRNESQGSRCSPDHSSPLGASKCLTCSPPCPPQGSLSVAVIWQVFLNQVPILNSGLWTSSKVSLVPRCSKTWLDVGHSVWDQFCARKTIYLELPRWEKFEYRCSLNWAKFPKTMLSNQAGMGRSGLKGWCCQGGDPVCVCCGKNHFCFCRFLHKTVCVNKNYPQNSLYENNHTSFHCRKRSQSSNEVPFCMKLQRQLKRRKITQLGFKRAHSSLARHEFAKTMSFRKNLDSKETRHKIANEKGKEKAATPSGQNGNLRFFCKCECHKLNVNGGWLSWDAGAPDPRVVFLIS